MPLSDYFPFLPPKGTGFVTPEGRPVHAIVAEFDTPAAVYKAAERIRDAGMRKWDVHSPFPIHGIEDAMGVRPTFLPRLVAAMGFAGAGLALTMQWWMNYIDFPMVVQGKSLNAWEPFMPVIFELGVLLAAFTSLLGMLALNGLPRWHHPLFSKDRFLEVSDDRFFICIEARDPQFDPMRTKALLEQVGGTNIDLVED